MQNNAAVCVSALVLICALSNRVWAQTPEQEKLWEGQRVQRAADDKAKAEQLLRQREARKTDPMAWVRTLHPMTEGGWVFRSVAPDGSWAAFSTDHQLKRAKHSVSVWLRQEYPEPQRNDDGDIFFSNVERIEYDCVKEKARVMLVIFYSENNIGGTQKTQENDPKTVPWEAIVPGTQGESIYTWACAGSDKGH